MSPARIAVFLLVACAILGGVHYYLWARLVRDPVLPGPWSSVATWTLVVLAVSVLGGFVLMRFAPREVASPILWVVYTWLGVMFFLVVLFGMVDLGRAVASVARRLSSGEPLDADRRTFLARVLGGVVGLATVGLASVSVVSALSRVKVKPVRVPIAGLPEAAHGYRIVQLTDIHVGPTIGKGFIEEIVATTNALEPDLVAITGDLVDGSVAELGALVAPLAELKAKDGVFFVTGNHEYYSGAADWVEFLATLGVRVLNNERVAIGAGFDLAGVPDPTASGRPGEPTPDIALAMVGRAEGRPVVLLAHQPKAVVEAAIHKVDLQLSGHTHGGQLFPFNFLVRLQQPYVAGLHAHEGTQVYVSNGTGYWGPPMRLGAPAEITHIELAPA